MSSRASLKVFQKYWQNKVEMTYLYKTLYEQVPQFVMLKLKKSWWMY